MDLPREIRDLIYGFAVGTHQVLYPYQHKWTFWFHRHWARPASINLLLVSKAIREEALPIFYRDNIWVLPDRLSLGRNHVIFDKYGHLMRSIVLPFDRHPSCGINTMTFDGIQTNIVPERQTKDYLLRLIPNVRTLIVDIPPCSCTCSEAETLNKIFKEEMKTRIGKDVDVLITWNSEILYDILNCSANASATPRSRKEFMFEEGKAMLQQWRNQGVETGDRARFYILTPHNFNTNPLQGMSKSSGVVVDTFYQHRHPNHRPRMLLGQLGSQSS